LAALVQDLNRGGRAALLPLGGADGETTALQGSAWHTGFGVRCSFHTGVPQFDPAAWSTERLVAEAEVDLLVWVSTLSLEPPPPTQLPTLVLGHPAMRFTREPELFVPLAVPGVHRRGAVHRGDGIGLLPLSVVNELPLPSGDDVMGRLLRLLSED
jgi:formylmethanofuran dehydrogenase subunit B